MVERVFHWADYLIFALFLTLSLGVGIFFAVRGRLRETEDDYLLGKRRMPWLPVAFSMMASLLSAVTLIGIPAEVYYNGVAFLIALLLVIPTVIAAHLYIPKFHQMKARSAYEYLEKRYNLPCRIAAGLTYTLSNVLYVAAIMYVPALAFARVTAMNLVMTIVVTGIICTIYTTIGGMKAVVWTDTLQSIIIVGGLLTLLILGAVRSGTASEIWETADVAGVFNITHPWDFHPHVRHTVWTQIVGFGVTYLAMIAANQTVVQRFFTVESVRRAQITAYVSTAMFCVVVLFTGALGIIMHAYYADCDPLFMGPGKGIKAHDEIVPYFLMEMLGHLHGLPGLFLAAVFAATLSTVSSGLNALSLVILDDILKPIYLAVTKGKTLSNAAGVWISKAIGLFFGILSVVLSYTAQWWSPLILQLTLSVAGAVNGPLLGLITLAFFVPFSNAWGAFVGLIVGLAFNLWLMLGAMIYRPPSHGSTTLGMQCENLTSPPQRAPARISPLSPFYNISYAWYGTNGMLTTMIVGVIASLIIYLFMKLSGKDEYLNKHKKVVGNVHRPIDDVSTDQTNQAFDGKNIQMTEPDSSNMYTWKL